MFLSFAIFFINIGDFLPVILENKHKRFHNHNHDDQNDDDTFEYNVEYEVLFCALHCTCVRGLDTHLRQAHNLRKDRRKPLLKKRWPR
jgi:hypothetical protein